MPSKHDLPVDVPCAVCLEQIRSWTDTDEPVGQPCGHAMHEIVRIWALSLGRRSPCVF